MLDASGADQCGFSPTPFVPDGPRPNAAISCCFFCATIAVSPSLYSYKKHWGWLEFFFFSNNKTCVLIDTSQLPIAFQESLKLLQGSLNFLLILVDCGQKGYEHPTQSHFQGVKYWRFVTVLRVSYRCWNLFYFLFRREVDLVTGIKNNYIYRSS